MKTLLKKDHYDVAIIGGGHNGLIAAAYLAKYGFSVLLLEKKATLGGAAVSEAIFPGVDIKVSVYAYLVGLLPQKILSDLQITFPCQARDPGVSLPYFDGDQLKSLIFSEREITTLKTFQDFPEGEKTYLELKRFRELQHYLGKHLWDTLLHPLVTKEELKKRFTTADEQEAWNWFIEKPLGESIEHFISDNDLIRGLVLTDGVIGCFSYAHDSSFRQNKTFLYHVLANGCGDWNVPIGGMEVLIKQLIQRCEEYGVEIVTDAEVISIDPDRKQPKITFMHKGSEHSFHSEYVLSNLAPQALEKILPEYDGKLEPLDEGCCIKINMILAKLPRLKSGIDPKLAFTGTFHINEGYENLERCYQTALSGELPQNPPGEIYCHSLTDPSIIPESLQKAGYVTMTLFGLFMPYSLFIENNEEKKKILLERYLRDLNLYLLDPIQDCLAKDMNGHPCLTIESPYDIEQKLNIPTGHVFHRALAWPFAEEPEEIGQWGVETSFDNIFICGAGAKRGGGISGVSAHNAAFKIINMKKISHHDA